jgi:hypothetical protein
MLGTGMNARKLGAICALLAATPNLIGCESSRDSPDRQFQKQVKRAQECRELQDKLVGDQPLTPERSEEITKTMDRTGCTTRLKAWLEQSEDRLANSRTALAAMSMIAESAK